MTFNLQLSDGTLIRYNLCVWDVLLYMVHAYMQDLSPISPIDVINSKALDMSQTKPNCIIIMQRLKGVK